jgi:hypothetical protein
LGELTLMQGQEQVFLLRDRGVQDDLKLNDEQRERVNRMIKEQNEQTRQVFRGYSERTPEERREQWLALARAREEAVNAAMTPAQMRRLQELVLQSHGLHAFSEPEVVAELRLTPEQRSQLRAIETELSTGFWAGAPGDTRSYDQNRKRLRERTLAVLSPAQLERWQQLMGEPHKGPLGGRMTGFWSP